MSNENSGQEEPYFAVPLLVKDVLALPIIQGGSTIFSFYGIKFSTVFLYGYITGSKDTHGKMNFDDGTGSIMIKPFDKSANDITELDRELSSCTHPNPEFINCLKRLMDKIKQQHQSQELSQVKPGTKVLILGKPEADFFGKYIKTSDILVDWDSKSCEIEINYKQNLIDWYLENVIKKKHQK